MSVAGGRCAVGGGAVDRAGGDAGARDRSAGRDHQLWALLGRPSLQRLSLGRWRRPHDWLLLQPRRSDAYLGGDAGMARSGDRRDRDAGRAPGGSRRRRASRAARSRGRRAHRRWQGGDLRGSGAVDGGDRGRVERALRPGISGGLTAGRLSAGRYGSSSVTAPRASAASENPSTRSRADAPASGFSPAEIASAPSTVSADTPRSRSDAIDAGRVRLARRSPIGSSTSGTWAKAGTGSPSAR